MNIWVNGCFDVLHVGHLNLLSFAKDLVNPKSKYKRINRLIVGIDSDERVRQLKGGDRPINNQEDRKSMLEALRMVDEVVIYNNETEMCDLISQFKIDFMVIGDDYKSKRVLCREHSKKDVVFYPKDNRSSTDIINKIKNS